MDKILPPLSKISIKATRAVLFIVSFRYNAAMAKKKKSGNSGNTIAQNKKARHDFHLSNNTECGIVLTGWEVKALRAGRCQLVDSYVFIREGEAWLYGCLITALPTAAAYIVTEPKRERKLLLHKREIEKLEQQINAKGYTCVCTALYWKGHIVKVDIALAKGKQDHDKRNADKDKDWAKQKERTMKHSVR
jgi:SsrA-binding protein